MGSDPTPTVPAGYAGGRRRPLWQVPVFLVGVAALAAAWFLRAPADSGPRQVARLLARARQILSRPDGDAEAAAEAAQNALDRAGTEGERAGEAYFLLGSAFMRQGDHTAGDEGRPWWVRARQALEEAERRGVSAEDRGRLHYRIAKVFYHTGDDPRQVAERLAASAADAEDGAEAYDLLTRAYLAQTPPDYQKALDANTKLREQPVLHDDFLAAVKLRSGELKLKLGRAEEARKDLELIGSSAPSAVLCKARLLRARSYQEEGKWAEAADQWQAALGDTREPPPDRAEVLYLLGDCRRRLDQADEAARAWEECVRVANGNAEGVAASVQLAELRLDRKEYAAAADLLAAVAGRVHKPADWNNPRVDGARVVEVFEKAVKACRGAGEFDLALQLTGHFERLAAPGRAVTLRAEAAAEWAKKRATPAEGGRVTPENEKAAHELFARSGAAYAECAAAAAGEARTDLLWQSAGRYLDGQDLYRAVSTLEDLLKEEQRPEKLGEGWFLLGEARRKSKDTDAAEAAYVDCLKYPTPFAYRARYQLALLYWQAGRADQARDILKQNLAQLRFDRDAEALEKSLYALGDFAYHHHDYSEVVKLLEEALGQFPSNPDQTRARYQLADSYRQLAVEAKRDEMLGDSPNPEYVKHLREKYRRFLQKAADEYQELAAFLEKPESAGHLTPDEREEVPLVAADCRYNLGQYQEALALYERLADANAGQRLLLLALGGAARCHSALGQTDKLRQRLEDIRKGLAGLKKSEREQWEEWLSLAARPGVPETAVNDRAQPQR
jgi:tetratricopeptide (TPR) repeat protein